ncbi:MAG: hypothetical protein ACFE9T_01305 [Promethearchaeota archaeon]
MNKPMKIDRVKLEISIVAGILLVLIVSIFLGFALVGGSLTNSDNIKPSINLEYKKLQVDIAGTDPYISGYNPIVSVAQKGCCCMDTVKGEIKIYDYNLPEVLPLCLTQEFLDNYYLTVAVTGGYDPIGGTITLYQKGEWKGDIDIVWTYLGHEPCYTDYWQANFVLTDGPIELDSNQWPDGAYPLFPEYCTIPGKEVCVVYESLWQGCIEQKQQFELIQIHQYDCIKISPQLPMRLS